MKRYYLLTILTAIAVLLVFSVVYSFWDQAPSRDTLTVGFLYKDDESVPDTYNFAQAQYALEQQYKGQVQIYSKSNVLGSEINAPIEELVRKGCELIFTNSDSEQVIEMARQYPGVQFCQTTYAGAETQNRPANYHTFYAKIHQARYVSGIAAGLKLRQMIDSGELKPEQALVGFVGDYPTADAVSSYTAFLLGIRSVAPEATMKVRYTRKWSSYNLEKACAMDLINEGCVVISQHTHTTGPAVACEEAGADKKVVQVGYHRSMLDVAPTTSLVSIRINWAPYVTQAVEAVLKNKPIETIVEGSNYGNNDISAGFDMNWVQILELNQRLAAEGTQARMDKAIESLKKGKLDVFRGNYLGVNPNDSTDVYDLNKGYQENQYSSWPTFHYVLKDVIQVE